MYQTIISPILGAKVQYIKRVSDGTHIPVHPDNTDYQEYLKWLEEGNTPLPADEPNEGTV